VHEIKHDGYGLQVRRDGHTIRLFTRRGYDWSARYPAIVVTAMQLRAASFTLDGEAAARTGSRSWTRYIATASSSMRCFTPSTCSSSTAKTFGTCR
jgi:hypothetical protein